MLHFFSAIIIIPISINQSLWELLRDYFLLSVMDMVFPLTLLLSKQQIFDQRHLYLAVGRMLSAFTLKMNSEPQKSPKGGTKK